MVDPYHWLSDREDSAVISYLEAENDFTEEQTGHLSGLRRTLFDEIAGRTQETDLTVPVREGSWWYFSRTTEGRQYARHVRVPASDWTPPEISATESFPNEQTVLDSNEEAHGADFYRLGAFDVSQDGRLLLYSVDTEGDERFEIRVREIDSGRLLPDRIPATFEGAVLSPDGAWIFYTTVDESWRPDTVWRHRIGTNVSDDEVVLHESDERFWAGVGVSRSGEHILIALGSNVTSEWLTIDAADPSSSPRIVWPREDGVEYDVEHAIINDESVFLILHNRNAVEFQLDAVPVDQPQAVADRRTLISADERIRLEAVDAFARYLAIEYRENGQTQIGTVSLTGDVSWPAAITAVAFDEPLYTVGFVGNPEWQQSTLRIHYTSFLTPGTVMDVDVATGELTTLKRQRVYGYDPTLYEQDRVWVPAADGSDVPVSLVRRRGSARPAPTLLHGYGAYEVSMDPEFSISRLSLLDRGVTFAIAHVRGGGELGRSWYEDGKLRHKRNTFTDFVDCARGLIRMGITRPHALVAEGGSAGGLLIGAALNLAPDLFAGAHAAVPFVDALTTILDPDLPLTVIEWDEWGDPLHDKTAYDYMRSYSPYENIRTDVAYPQILVTTSLNDTRVFYAEPAKWVARLRDVDAPVLLRTEMSAGHGGVSGRYSAWRERAWELAWILDVLTASRRDQPNRIDASS